MRRAGPWLSWVTALLLVLALILTYADRALLRTGPFTDRVVAAMRDDAVRTAVADHLTNALVNAGSGDLAAVRPLIRPIVGTVVVTPAFTALLRHAVRDAHRALVTTGSGPILVNLADAGVLVAGVLQRLAPDAARRINAERVTTLLTIDPGGFFIGVVRTVRRLHALGWVCAALAVLLAILAVWRTADRRLALQRTGRGLLAAGLVIVSVYIVGGAVAGQIVQTGRAAAVRALWRIFLHGLFVEALILAAAGAAIAALAAEGVGRTSAVGLAADARAVLSGRTVARRRQAVLSIGLGIVGVLILLEPSAAVSLVAALAGLYVCARGIQGLARALDRVPPSVRDAPAPETAPAAAHRHGRRYGALVVGTALAAGALIVALTGATDEAPAEAATTCNGYAVLCERPLNDVAFAATHNSMASVTIPTWLFGQQDGTIRDQLATGIRGLLIDSYYGERAGGRVRTDLRSLPKTEVAVRELGAPAVDAALHIRARLARAPAGPRDIFLCHGFCELGAITLASALQDLRSFLVSQPGAVVMIINQDEGVTPDDIARAFDRAGLGDLIYRGSLGPFPTLRHMIDSGQRLVVMAENDAGAVPWYHLAYAHALQETPFRFTRVSQLTDRAQLAASCRPHRGSTSAPLFLLNHWIDTTPVPRASNAALVNAPGALLTRAQMCQRIRHRLPNLVAVDFFRRGDVIGVVNALNRVSDGQR